VLIVGHGRSGTNWLLRVLDLAPTTHCRNEPNEIRGAPLAGLPSAWICKAEQPLLAKRWDEAVQWAAQRYGKRDHRLRAPKEHVFELSRRLGLSGVVERPRLRSLMSKLSPALRRREWVMPWWLGRHGALEQALAVLKIVQAPGWATWVLANRPNVRVLHIVRHPGGFLNSWRRRYLAKRDAESVSDANRARLKLIAEESRDWAERFGDIETMAVEESELWYWLYACEQIHRAGHGSPMYHLVVYEEMADEPVRVARGVFEACGLPWTQELEEAVRGDSGESRGIAEAWRGKIGLADAKIIDRVLEGSAISHFWD
jgi:hypothetical protein